MVISDKLTKRRKYFQGKRIEDFGEVSVCIGICLAMMIYHCNDDNDGDEYDSS